MTSWRLALLAVLLLTTPVAAGSITVTVSSGSFTSTQSGGPQTQGEWLGIYPAAGGELVNWQWMSGGQALGGGNTNAPSGSVLTWPINITIALGTYVVKWYAQAVEGGVWTSAPFFFGGGEPPPPPPPPPDWVPMQPTAQGYVDLYQGAAGARGDLEPYEFDAIVGAYKWRSPWIKNTTTAPADVVIPVNGGAGNGLTGQVNAAVYVRASDGDPAAARPAHVNIAATVNGTSEHNAVMGPLRIWPGQSYRAYFYIGLPEFWYEVAP